PYRPPLLRLALSPVAMDLPQVSSVSVAVEATVFDFAAVSLALRVPFHLNAVGLSHLAGWLADPRPILQAARSAAEPLHQKLLPAIQSAVWRDDLSEEYFVFQLDPEEWPPAPDLLRDPYANLLAGLVRLETGPLSPEEVAEALRLHISYSPEDLLVADWAAAVLVDSDCEETLQAIAFANLQLLE